MDKCGIFVDVDGFGKGAGMRDFASKGWYRSMARPKQRNAKRRELGMGEYSYLSVRDT